MINLKEKYQKIPLELKVSVAYVICNIIQRGLSFITLPLFTRILTTEQYGQYTIYSSWHGFLMIFLTLNLAYGSFSKAMIKYEEDRNGYISAVEGVSILLGTAFLIIYLPFKSLWNVLFELPTSIIILMVGEILCTNAILLWNGRNRFEFKYKAVIVVTLLISILSPILSYILIMSTSEKGYARIWGYAIIYIVVGGFFFIYNIAKGKKTFNKEYWKYALDFNIPLLAYYLSQVVFNQSDRIMISHIVGKDKAAIYGVAYSLAMVLTFVLNAINNSYVPWYYGKIKEGRICDNRNISLAIAGLMAILLLSIIWFAPEIISIMAGEKYVEAIHVVPPVAISLLLLFYSQLFINVEFYYEEKQKLVYASIGAALVNLILNYIFIKLFGFQAAAYTTLASYIIFVIANYSAMKKVLNKNGVVDDGFNYKGLLALLGGFVLVSYIGVALYNLLIVRVFASAIVLLIMIVKRKKIVGLFKKLKDRQSISTGKDR